jgi:hypothetical protein
LSITVQIVLNYNYLNGYEQVNTEFYFQIITCVFIDI